MIKIDYITRNDLIYQSKDKEIDEVSRVDLIKNDAFIMSDFLVFIEDNTCYILKSRFDLPLGIDTHEVITLTQLDQVIDILNKKDK